MRIFVIIIKTEEKIFDEKIVFDDMIADIMRINMFRP